MCIKRNSTFGIGSTKILKQAFLFFLAFDQSEVFFVSDLNQKIFLKIMLVS